jgi:geranylgeranyl pyrophosphate synthase
LRQNARRWCDCQEIDVEYEVLRLTLAIVLKELLSVDLEQRTDEIARAANTLIEMIHCRTLPIIDDLLDKIALGRIRRFNNARAQFDAKDADDYQATLAPVCG